MRSHEIVPESVGILRNPDYVDALVLVANTAVQLTMPAGAAFVYMTSNCDIYVAYGANPTAVVPSVNVTDGTSNELNPAGRYIEGVAKMSFISPQGGVVTVAIFRA